MSVVSGSSWEDLRKQARHLENDIDVKLVAFSKLGVSSGTSNLSSETVPLINSDDMFDTMSMELQQLLNKLSAINDTMADMAPSGAATMHTIKRHREILMDYQQEFSKTSARVSARREREELLRGGSPPPSAAAGLSRRDQYTKEANHLHSSHILVDEQINIAMEAREHLTSQRQTFKRIQTRFNDITNRFPMLNSLIYRINARKRRDSLILGLVVALCTFLLLFYAFH
ncbi:Golgi SNAP receptor complex member 1 [Battus philenor]|uniref:Golgi SNAP receptor complex member 1 n=1 Tax=Battus philenor TaxID=42288 RepID=UPI0035CF3F2C